MNDRFYSYDPDEGFDERTERDALRGRVAAQTHVVQCARRVVEAWDACDREAALPQESQSSAPMVRYIEAQTALRRAVAALAEPHVAELSAPVVPEGWGIGPIISAEASGWAVTVDGNIVVMWHPQRTGGDIKACIKAPVAVFAALLHAIRTNQRPPHAKDTGDKP